MPVRRLALRLALAVAIVVAAAVTAQAQPKYDWDVADMPDPSTWASYFRQHARLRLGPEQRLPNGVAWRLVTDIRSAIAMPRLTWMRDRRRLLAANRLLEQIHGGEALLVASYREELWRAYTTIADPEGERALIATVKTEPVVFQADVGLTLAGGRFLSVFSGGWFWAPASHPPEFLRGLTFDLDAGTVTQVLSCDSAGRYGNNGGEPHIYRFRYGSLLDLCDAADYRRFVALVREIDDAQPARHLPPEESDRTKGCWRENPDQPLVREDQEYVLYLTFTGLAVHVADDYCPDARRPDNPIIVPYRRLEPLMQPGPWRDELLALQ
jgi:hypothetical protein